MCERRKATDGRDTDGSAQPKTRTPHKDLGKMGNMPTNAINHIAGRVCQADFQKISGLKKGDAMYQADTSRCSKSPLVD